jgi:hypothetical protein
MDENVTENNLLDFNSALNALDKASDTFKIEVWIPSRQEYLTFKGLNAKQQKELLNAAMDTSVYNTTFITTFYDILKNNIINNDSATIDSLSLSDKICIAMTLKSQISDSINVTFDDAKNISNKYSVNDILNKFKSYKSPETVILESHNNSFILKVEIVPPTIKTEVDYDNQFKGNKKSEDIKSNEDVKILITNAFLGELSKYVNKIWINDDEVVLNNLKFDQRIKIIEKLPSVLIQKILETITEWKAKLDEILTVKHDEYVKTINVDSVLFLN